MCCRRTTRRGRARGERLDREEGCLGQVEGFDLGSGSPELLLQALRHSWRFRPNSRKDGGEERAQRAPRLAVALVASSYVASAAPKDKVDVLDGATLDDPSREPKPVPGAFSTIARSRDRDQAAHPRSPRSRPHALVRDLQLAGELRRRGPLRRRIFIDPSDYAAGFNAPQIAATPRLGGLGKRPRGGQPGQTPETGRGP
jgi:hypothetical protein